MDATSDTLNVEYYNQHCNSSFNCRVLRVHISQKYVKYKYTSVLLLRLRVQAITGFRLLFTFLWGFLKLQACCLVSPALRAATLWVLSFRLPLCALRVALWAVKLCSTLTALGAGFLEPTSLWLSRCALRVVHWTRRSLNLRVKARWLGSLS